MRRIRTLAVSSAFAFAALLSACAPGAPTDDGDPVDPAPEASADQPCEVGFWLLDVGDYAAQSEQFLLGLGLPIEGFAMTGEGSVDIGADGVITGVVSLTSTGTIVAGGTSVPFETPSAYTFSGSWAVGAEPDTIDLSDWATVYDEGGQPSADAPGAPAIDFTDIPTVSSECSADSLRLQEPGTPMSALFQREG